MPHPLLSDPWIAEQIESAVAPYAGRLPARELDWMREQLAEMLTHDEHASRLLRQAHPREVEQSGERLTPGATETARLSDDLADDLGPVRAKLG
ncbi:hypothetical protein [Chondromyces apiculatus]|uniref:Uncharacterized protein n=1 Tax=Chondromyces apiculatus DSM 436 TaxID=1192034 RepID=A0A017T0L4_9BACT|nr:hypothetical protein [Chondromyces apiculatus]EYF02405.1 Hypothetical protein CAP_7176 [Chondromyces apiculatus DSM 436]